MRAVSLGAALAIVLVSRGDACSTIVAGPKATKDGSTLASHSNDGGGSTDGRLMRVPARDHAKGSLRPIYYATEDYPRYVGGDLGPSYMSNWTGGAAGYNNSVAIGHIPQVEHTYAYFVATYGVMNEHQVAFGEGTCGCLFGAKPVNKGGKALLSIDTMSQIGLERAKSAKEAVQIMGDLAVQYGFYGEGFEGSGESLMVIDPKNAWVFHVSPDPTGGSAIWAAQRVPDDHVAVVDNMYAIREVDTADTENFLFAPKMHQIAIEQKLWKPDDGLLDFAGVFSSGEYGHKYYSGRRMWGSFRLLAPSVNLSSHYGNLKTDRPHPYPFSIKPDALLEVGDLFAVHRSNYENTSFDATAGLAAGAYGQPNRYGSGSFANGSGVSGNWERTLSIYRTTYSQVVQARAWLPDAVGGTVWWGPHAAHATCYAPLPIGLPSLPHRYTIGYQAAKDDSALWAFRYAENLAQMRFGPMMRDIKKVAATWERRALSLQAATDARFMENLESSARNASESMAPVPDLSAYLRHADEMLDAWWALGDFLMLKHAQPAAPGVGAAVSYPGWWLEAVGYPAGPPPVDSPNSQGAHGPPQAGRPRASPARSLAACIQGCPEDSALFQKCTRRCLADWPV